MPERLIPGLPTRPKTATVSNGWKKTDAEQKTFNKVKGRFDDAKQQWIYLNRERFDQFYKNFRDYGEDRMQRIKKLGGQDWMSNLFVPLTASHVRALQPRVIESRPEMRVLGRSKADHAKAQKVQTVLEYVWDKSNIDAELRKLVWIALVYGTAFGKVIWSQKRRAQYQSDYDESIENPKLIEDSLYYDDPDFQAVDAYDLYPDPAATSMENMRYLCQRYVMTKEEIVKTWLNLKNMEFVGVGGDTANYKFIRQLVPRTKFAERRQNTISATGEGGTSSAQAIKKELIEVIEYWEDDRLIVIANDVIIKDISNPYPTKEIPYVRLVYEELPFEMYGVGVVEQIEQVQYGLNTIRNQRIDNVTMAIHKMFIVNPLALVDENDLTTRPFGIIRTPDPNAVKAVEFGDIKQSAYSEDSLMVETAKFATGIDDFTRGIGGPASLTATAVTAQKESTSDRVKNFVRNMETEVFSKTMRLWISYIQAFYPTKTISRINDDKDGMNEIEVLDVNVRSEQDGQIGFPVIEKDDVKGFFDYRIASNSTVAGTQDLKLKKVLELMDRAIAGGVNPATGEQIIDLRALWGDVLIAYGYDPSTLLVQKAEPSEVSPDISKGPQLPAGVDSSDAAMRLLGLFGSGPESGVNAVEGGSEQGRPGAATPPPQLPELRAEIPINQQKPEIGTSLSQAMQT